MDKMEGLDRKVVVGSYLARSFKSSETGRRRRRKRAGVTRLFSCPFKASLSLSLLRRPRSLFFVFVISRMFAVLANVLLAVLSARIKRGDLAPSVPTHDVSYPNLPSFCVAVVRSSVCAFCEPKFTFLSSLAEIFVLSCVLYTLLCFLTELRRSISLLYQSCIVIWYDFLHLMF